MKKVNNTSLLDVKNLRISFTTNNGTVKAVRGISFSLYKGRTLAIVGESGSGKSVSSKAIMGLLAGNKIIEEGQILFDGKDLLSLSEEEFVQIRGSRISMIFQDPMSSLNPIMKVGKQLTESMVLKNKSTRKMSRKNKRHLLKAVNNCPIEEKEELVKRVNELIINKEIEASKNKKQLDKMIVSISSLEGKEGKEEELNQAILAKDEFLKEHFVEYVIDEENEKLLLEVIRPLIAHYHEQTVNARNTAKVLLETLLKHFYDGGSFSIDAVKQSINQFKEPIKACNTPYYVEQDNLISTFRGRVKDLVKKHHEFGKKVAKDDVFFEKLERKEAEGKNVEQERVKFRSFNSEIRYTPEMMEQQIVDLFNNMISHLEELLLNEGYDEVKEAQRFIESIQRAERGTLTTVARFEAKNRAIALLNEVGIPQADKRYKQYPFELSGGMRQRVVIAIALASNPEILICDEPTTALDVTIQAQILELINKIKAERNLSIIFITHNLGVVANMADDIAVMYAGKIVEYADAYELFYNPMHPYTWALLASMPDLNSKERLHPIKGTPPNMILPPKGDAFAARNEFALNIDFEKEPPMFKVGENHYVASWLVAPGAPKVKIPKIVTERIRIMKERGGKKHE